MTEATSVTIVDGQYIFNTLKFFKEIGAGNPSMDYGQLKKVLDGIVVEKLGFRKTERTVFVYAIDPASDQQKRFVQVIKDFGYDICVVDYWRTYVSLPGIAYVSDFGKKNSVPTLSPLISYMIGKISSRPNPQVIVVSGSFGLFDPLLDFAENHEGKAAIAYFQRFLNPQWRIMGFGKLQFYDLEPHAEELLGASLEIAKKSIIDI